MRLYETIENGVADLSDPRLNDRVAELTAIRDQSRIDADRAVAEIERQDRRSPHRRWPHLPGTPESGCVTPKRAIAATIRARSHNGSRLTSGESASSATRARSSARSSAPHAGNRRELAFPVLFRSGAPNGIGTLK